MDKAGNRESGIGNRIRHARPSDYHAVKELVAEAKLPVEGLEEHFAEPNARLERLLGRELGWGTPAAATRPAGVASTPAE